MKKVLIVVALLLALPALSFAGSATSRWDISIGGYVKFDVGYISQNVNQDPSVAARPDVAGVASATDAIPSLFWYSGETRLNFLIRGPDAWGAKTMAFIEASFEQVPSQYSLGLRHAYMQFTWPTTRLIMGQFWQPWALAGPFNIVSYSILGPYNKGIRLPQITLIQNLTKELFVTLSVNSPYNVNSESGAYGSTTAQLNSTMPDIVGEIGYESLSCGAVGPYHLLVSLDGITGQDKYYAEPGANLPFMNKSTDRWGIALRFNLPLIPEKNHNKTGAMFASGMFYEGQDIGTYVGAAAAGIGYNRATGDVALANTNPQAIMHALDPIFSVVQGGMVGTGYYWTDKLSTSVYAGYQTNNYSNAFRAANPNSVRDDGMGVANIIYDINPAISVGLEYDYIITHYNENYVSAAVNGPAANVSNSTGTLYEVRLGAWYFF